MIHASLLQERIGLVAEFVCHGFFSECARIGGHVENQIHLKFVPKERIHVLGPSSQIVEKLISKLVEDRELALLKEELIENGIKQVDLILDELIVTTEGV